MDQRTSEIISGAMNGTVLAIDTLIRHLAQSGIVDREEVARVFDARASAAEELSDFPPGVPRMDLLILREIAKALQNSKSEGWKPVIIDGGKTSRDDPDQT